MTSHCTTRDRCLVASSSPSRPGVAALFSAVWDTLVAWQQRAKDRAHLAELPDTLRCDLGLTDAEIAAETRKPFWRS